MNGSEEFPSLQEFTAPEEFATPPVEYLKSGEVYKDVPTDCEEESKYVKSWKKKILALFKQGI